MNVSAIKSIRFGLIPAVFLIIAFVKLGCRENPPARPHRPPEQPRQINLLYPPEEKHVGHVWEDLPREAASIEDIKSYFLTTKGVAIEVREISVKAEDYYFVWQNPFSGLDRCDLYGFIKRNGEWSRFLEVVVPKGYARGFEFKPDGDFIDVTCRGEMVFRINMPW